MISLFKVYELNLTTSEISPNYVFLEVPSSQRVHTILREFVKATGHREAFLELWKPNDIESSVDVQIRIKSLLKQHHGDLGKFCTKLRNIELKTISDQFHVPARSRDTHATTLLAQILPAQPVDINPATAEGADSAEEETDVLAPLLKRFAISNKTPEFTPSKGATPTAYRLIQNGECPLLDRRYASQLLPIAAPIEIYHPVFPYFLAEIAREDLTPPSDFVSSTMAFMKSVSQIATRESERAGNTREALYKLLGQPIGQTVNPDRSSADHCIGLQCRGEPSGLAGLVFVEEKFEMGQSGEGCVQGSLSYHAHWRQATGTLKKACFCPSFIVSLAGPWIAICGAIWTSDVIIQHLTGYVWLGRSGHIEEDHLLRVARMFYALNRAVSRLAQYYEDLDTTILEEPNLRFFPLATSYKTDNGNHVSFKYTAFLKEKDPSCLTFLATLKESEKKVVVKFVDRYGEDEHQLLAEKGYAPQLLYYGHIWDETKHGSEDGVTLANAGCGPRRMVVMEYVEGKTLQELGADVPRDRVCDALREIIAILHQQQSVHGDIRSPNILLTDVEEDDVKERIRIIDFDWAGREGTVRYPYDLSQNIKWPIGVKDNALILKEHDEQMIALL
ncbi:hypothetical protein K474DRAFT_1669143 [Panus rudis PR-1116 ss-1]|nr:hypothetical protein K474DRAFT_1669143 [Panus rudis PR-1116 ss-1]